MAVFSFYILTIVFYVLSVPAVPIIAQFIVSSRLDSLPWRYFTRWTTMFQEGYTFEVFFRYIHLVVWYLSSIVISVSFFLFLYVFSTMVLINYFTVYSSYLDSCLCGCTSPMGWKGLIHMPKLHHNLYIDFLILPLIHS